MKSTGEQGEIVPVEADVVVTMEGGGGRGEQDSSTTAISNAIGGSSGSTSDEEEEEEEESNCESNNQIVIDNDHRSPYHASVVDIEQSEGASGRNANETTSSPKGISSAKSTPASVRIGSPAVATTTTTVHVETKEKRQKKSVSPKNNKTCEFCNYTNNPQTVVDHPGCQRSKSLPSSKKQAGRGGGGPNLGDSSEITTIREFTSEQSNSVSGVLRFCKRRVLFPYLKLLGAMGLKPLYSDGNDSCVWALILSKLYLVLVGLVLIIGYALQFMTCFRRDHGFSYKQEILSPPTSLTDTYDYGDLSNGHHTNSTTSHAGLLISRFKRNADLQTWIFEDTICSGNVIYVYLIPSILHMGSFIYMVYLYWIYDDEHLQNLMERVFIQAAHANINFFSQRRLIRRLQGLVGIGIIWITILTVCQVLQVFFHKIYINVWIELEYNMTYAMSTVLLFATLWQDAIQVTIVMSFAIQCNLICTYTELIKGRLMQHSISLAECMKELGELGQLLSYLNNDLALGLAPLLLIDGIYATGAIVHLVKYGKYLSFSILIQLALTAVLWIFIIVFPLAQAASVSTCCQKLKDMGHMIRIRPFGYQFVSQSDLDSFLLFVSNLNLKARILKVPITSPILSLVAIALSIAVFLWGYFQ